MACQNGPWLLGADSRMCCAPKHLFTATPSRVREEAVNIPKEHNDSRRYFAHYLFSQCSRGIVGMYIVFLAPC